MTTNGRDDPELTPAQRRRARERAAARESILSAARDLARREGCAMMMLDAYKENDKAHAFYEREGFTRRGYHFLKRL